MLSSMHSWLQTTAVHRKLGRRPFLFHPHVLLVAPFGADKPECLAKKSPRRYVGLLRLERILAAENRGRHWMLLMQQLH